MKKIIATLAAAGTVTVMAVSCKSAGEKQAMQTQQRKIDSLKTEMVKKQIIDSMNEVARQQPILVNNEVMPVASPAPVYTVKHEVKHTTVHHHAKRKTHSNRNTNSSANSSNDYAGNSNSYQESTPVAYAEQPQPQAQKKGWSSKATGTLIGAGAGAAAGALIGRNKGIGALIGGAVGAAAGLGTGAIIDHKKGR
jgi:hypothetical protein